MDPVAARGLGHHPRPPGGQSAAARSRRARSSPSACKLAGHALQGALDRRGERPCRKVVWEGKGPVMLPREGGVRVRAGRRGHALLVPEPVRPSGWPARAGSPGARVAAGHRQGAGRIAAAPQGACGITVSSLTFRLMADFLDEKRKEIDSRLQELRPLVDEYNRLEKAAAALAGVGGTAQRLLRRRHAPPARPAPPLARAAAARAAAEHAPSRRSSWCGHEPGINDRRAGRRDGHQGELPVPRDAEPGIGRPGEAPRQGLAPGLTHPPASAR